MNMDINFPNLHIYLKHVGKGVEIFGFPIAFYRSGPVRSDRHGWRGHRSGQVDWIRSSILIYLYRYFIDWYENLLYCIIGLL